MNNLAIVFGMLSCLSWQGTSAGACGNWPTPGFDGPAMRRFVGAYSNPNYGFAVRIPDGLSGHDDPAPNPHHGFGIALSWEPRSYIAFDGSYNAIGWSAAEMETWHLRVLSDESERVLLVQRETAKLGPLDARRIIVRRTCKGHVGTFVADQTLALSADRGIVYSATLVTVERRFERDRVVLGEMLKTWKLSPIR